MSIRWGTLVMMLGCTVLAEGADVQLLDPSIFGQQTSAAVRPLFDRKGGEIEPSQVRLDVLCGRYRAATVVYPASACYSDVSASLTRLYGSQQVAGGKDQKTTPWLWRVVDAEGWPLAIQLTTSDCGSGKEPSVIYIRNAAWVKECEAHSPEK